VGSGFPIRRHDNGRPVKIVSIVDEHTRECLGGLVERSIAADRPINELDRIAVDRGDPGALRCDDGPGLACQAMADLSCEGVRLMFIPPGQPWRNGYIPRWAAAPQPDTLQPASTDDLLSPPGERTKGPVSGCYSTVVGPPLRHDRNQHHRRIVREFATWKVPPWRAKAEGGPLTRVAAATLAPRSCAPPSSWPG
jgi:hypothetical protein